jgi:hypothetical protein
MQLGRASSGAASGLAQAPPIGRPVKAPASNRDGGATSAPEHSFHAARTGKLGRSQRAHPAVFDRPAQSRFQHRAVKVQTLRLITAFLQLEQASSGAAIGLARARSIGWLS